MALESLYFHHSNITRPFMVISNNRDFPKNFIQEIRRDFKNYPEFYIDDLLVSHIDTVPYQGKLGSNKTYKNKDKNIYGRGANDMKTQVAAALLHCIRLSRISEYKRDFALVIASDEEHSGPFTMDWLNHLKADRTFDIEPTSTINNAYANKIDPYHFAIFKQVPFNPLLHEAVIIRASEFFKISFEDIHINHTDDTLELYIKQFMPGFHSQSTPLFQSIRSLVNAKNTM